MIKKFNEFEKVNERNDDIHYAHCNQGEYEGSCKYGEVDCPVLDDENIDVTWWGSNRDEESGGDAYDQLHKLIEETQSIKAFFENEGEKYGKFYTMKVDRILNYLKHSINSTPSI
ncbi:MAG: hypothetical protein SLAVMIC_00284 [uncultured marine phage]|uniref:Uncharacterized protein n=1 Tax=uncultured marine phage TaxID=707152 RepID=A0A8D9FRF0_9VIRU|nr:MAG: hypothetical protein SLAVMIC_00284 [uncultured marine phage]